MRRRRTRRAPLLIALAGLLLFGIGALAGVGLASRTAPSRLREAFEASLSDALGTPVTLGEVRLLVFPGLTVTAADASAWSGPDRPAFTAARVAARVDLAALLTGRLRFSALAVDGARLSLVRGSDGRWTPPLLGPDLENPLGLLERVFATHLRVSAIDVRGGHLTLTDLAGARRGAARAPTEIESITLRLLGPGLLGPGRLTATGTLVQTKGGGARLEVDAVAARGDRPRLELTVANLDLQRLEPFLRRSDPRADLEGRAQGFVSAAPAGESTTEVCVDLALRDLRAVGGSEPLRSAPLIARRASLQGAFRVAPDAFSVTGGRLQAGDLSLSLAGSLGRPVDGNSQLTVEAALAGVDVARLREAPAWLPPTVRRGLENTTRALVSGRLEALSLEGAASIDGWQAALEPDGPWLPAGARVETDVVDLTFQPAGDEPVTAIRGHALLESPDVLTVSGFEGRLGDRPLPVLDLRLEGLRHVLAAPSAPVQADVPPLPGTAALREILRGDDPGPGWSSVAVDADWILHPALFRPLRDVAVRIDPTTDGVEFTAAHASWGGLPIRGAGRLSGSPVERVRIALTADPAIEAPAPDPAPESWARGRFVVERPAPPGLHVSSLRGGFELKGAQLTVFDASAALAAPGRLTGDVRLDLGHPDEVPARLRFSLDDARVSDLLASLSDDPAGSSGSIAIAARLDGPLRPGAPVLTTLEGAGRITARDGELDVELPLLLAIAKASTTFNPFGSASGIRFDLIEADLRAEGGRLSTVETITIESPDLRLAVSGTVDLRTKPRPLEAVVGCFFFEPLDQVLGIVPFVSRILLGPDRSLFGSYFTLTGSWEDPKAGILPARTLALGPASFLLEDVPAFVARGIEAIQSVLPRTAGRPPAVASPGDAAGLIEDGS